MRCVEQSDQDYWLVNVGTVVYKRSIQVITEFTVSTHTHTHTSRVHYYDKPVDGQVSSREYNNINVRDNTRIVVTAETAG